MRTRLFDSFLLLLFVVFSIRPRALGVGLREIVYFFFLCLVAFAKPQRYARVVANSTPSIYFVSRIDLQLTRRRTRRKSGVRRKRAAFRAHISPKFRAKSGREAAKRNGKSFYTEISDNRDNIIASNKTARVFSRRRDYSVIQHPRVQRSRLNFVTIRHISKFHCFVLPL